MKLRHVFSVVIGAHLAVAAFLFVTPGCQSGSGSTASADADGQGGYTASDTVPPRATYVKDWETGPVYTPQQTPSTDGRLYAPTRPDWNVNENNSAAIVAPGANDESVEVLQPVRSSSQTTSASFGELVPVESETSVVAVESTGTTYKVRAGDNLSKIAREHGVSVSALMAANGLTRETANKIRVGQELSIPGGTSVVASETVTAMGSVSPVAASGDVYEVVSGDTLGGIALRHGTTVAALRSANNISGDRINVGQKLRLPKGAAAQSGSAVSSSTPVSQTRVGDGAASAAVDSSGQYTVRSGDTLGAIASRNGTTVQAILRANNMTDPNRLRLGQKLVIPGKAATQATPAQGSSQSTTAPVQATPVPSVSQPSTPEPVTTLPSFGGGTMNSGQGSGDDLLDADIPSVDAQ